MFFIPHAIIILSTTAENFIRQSNSSMINLLTHPLKSTAPILQLCEITINGLLQVTNLLNSNQVTSTVLQHQYQLDASAEEYLSLPHALLTSEPSPALSLAPITVFNPVPTLEPSTSPSLVPS